MYLSFIAINKLLQKLHHHLADITLYAAHVGHLGLQQKTQEILIVNNIVS